MPALRIDDGYTLDFQTDADVRDAAGYEVYVGLPVITGTYRPPSYKRLTRFRFEYTRAASGDDQTRIACEFIAERVASWDVTYGDAPAPIKADFLADKVGEPFVSQLLSLTARWGPKGGFPKKDAGAEEGTQEADAGN